MTQPLRIVFAGTPEFAAEHLKALLHSPYQVVAVYTQPDRPAGRGRGRSLAKIGERSGERRRTARARAYLFIFFCTSSF